MKNFDLENVDLPVEDVQITDDEISFGKHGKIKDKEYVADVDEVAPVVDAVVVEDVAVEEAVPAPIAVEAEPEPVYNAPIEEPVHHVRWPWALLALPLLAIPFIPRTTTVTEPVAVVTTPVVREVIATPLPAPVCTGNWVVKDATTLRATATATGAKVLDVPADSIVIVDSAAQAGYYHVTIDAVDGYLPVASVNCVLGHATTTVTG